MKTINLSERLKAVASFVPQGAFVADVGTDHGYIPVWLIQSGTAGHVIASDINEGPLETAKQSAVMFGADGIDFRLCDGLSAVRQDEADTVIIAGMGGENVSAIIGGSGWNWQGKRLILQPMSKQAELVFWLYENGFSVTAESFAADKGDIYRVLLAVYKPAELPRKAFIHGGFTYSAYAETQITKLRRAVNGLEKASVSDEEKIKEYRFILEDMENAYGERGL